MYSLMPKTKSVPVKIQNEEFDKKSDQLINNFSMNKYIIHLKLAENLSLITSPAITLYLLIIIQITIKYSAL